MKEQNGLDRPAGQYIARNQAIRGGARIDGAQIEIEVMAEIKAGTEGAEAVEDTKEGRRAEITGDMMTGAREPPQGMTARVGRKSRLRRQPRNRCQKEQHLLWSRAAKSWCRARCSALD